MPRTFIRPLVQIRQSDTYTDNTAPAATMESGATNLEDDLNNLRSMLNEHIDNQAGNWYDGLAVPATFTGEGEVARGINTLNSDLHELERKRVLRCVWNLHSVSVGAGNNFVILGTGELPSNTTAALGAVTTQGTVIAAHGGTFGTHALSEVAGATAISPKNLLDIVAASSRDEILSGGRKVYGLLQAESGVTDGGTITDTTTTRAQISFVRINATGDDLEAVPFSDIENQSIDYCSVERVGLDSLNEQDFLKGAAVDVPASATVTRKVAYDNQGTTPVDLTTAATLDLEGAGLTWSIRDDLEANLFSIVEGSAGGTSQFNVHADVDEYDNDAAVVNFASGASINSGGTRPITVGVTDGVIESTAGDLRINATTELFFDDGNQTGSTWAQTDGIKLSETTTEWDTFETNFGEVSLLNAINQAYSGQIRTKVQAALTANVNAGVDVNGPGTAHNNTDVDLAPFDQVTFVDDVEVYLNGELLRNDAASGGSNDVYPGGTPAEGDLAFNLILKGTGQVDVLTVIVNGQ